MFEREDEIVSLVVNMTDEIGGYGEFDEDSVRVHETDESWEEENTSMIQQRWVDEDNLEISWLMDGLTPMNATRYYVVQFDILENGPKDALDEEYLLNREDETSGVEVVEDGHVWVRGTDYEVKIDVYRGGSRVIKYRNSTRKGYVHDTTWMSWHSEELNWRKKGAEVNVTEEGALYTVVEITSPCGELNYDWIFYDDHMRVEGVDRDVSFDTIADNVINTEGTLVWSDGSTDNLTMIEQGRNDTSLNRSEGRGPPDERGPPDDSPGRRYREYIRVTDYFYIVGSEDRVTNRSAGFWAVPENGYEQTIYNAGAKGTRWRMRGGSARFGFTDYNETEEKARAVQYSPTVSRDRTKVLWVDPIIEDEVSVNEQDLSIHGDLVVTTDAYLKMDDMSVVLDERSGLATLSGSVTEITGSEVYFMEAGEGQGQIAARGELDMERSSVFTDEGHYLRITLRERSVIRDSRFRHLWNGIEVVSDDIELINADIRYSMGAGILVAEGYSPVVRGGEITGCRYGIRTGGAPENSTYDPAEAAFSFTPENPEVGEEVEFTCETRKTHEVMELHRDWTFGDGTRSTDRDPTHTYLLPSIYTVQLTVISEVSGYVVGITRATARITADATEGPTAAFDVDYPDDPGYPPTARTHEDIDFIDESKPENEAELVEWKWDLGDGTEKTFEESTTVTHSYSDPGTYTVGLTVEDDEGRTATHEEEIEVRTTSPRPKIELPEAVPPGEEITLDGSGSYARDGEIVEWEWSYIVDGEEETIGDGEEIDHVFEERDHYTTILRVEDEHGTYGSTEKSVRVGDVPVGRISEHKVVSELEYQDDTWVSTITLDGGDSYHTGDIEIDEHDWDLPEDADVLSEGEEITYEISYAVDERIRGVYFVELTVKDEDGVTDSTYTRVVEHLPETPPVEDLYESISDMRIYGNTYGVFLYGSDEYTNIFNSRIYDNTYGIYSYWEDFAIKDTHVFDNRRWTIMLENSFMMPVTGGYDRRGQKMRFNLDERFPDRENNADLSGDGFGWEDEIWRYGFNPWFFDQEDTNTDGEWLPNVEQADEYGTDPLSPDTDGDGVCDETEVTGAVTRYVADHGEKGYKFYTSWEEITEDHGPPDETFNYTTNPLNPDTDFSGLNDSVDPIPKDYDMNGDERINHVDLVDENSPYYVERIARAAKNDPWLDRDAAGELIGSSDMSGDGVLNENAEDMSRDGMPTWYEKEYGVADGGWQHPYLHNARYGILLASGSWDSEANHPSYWNDIKYLYDVLLEDYNYLEENVHLLYSVWGDEDQDHSDGCEDVDDEATMPRLRNTIEKIEQKMTTNDFLKIALRGHSGPVKDNKEKIIDSGFMLIHRGLSHERTETLWYSDLNDNLEGLSYNRIAIIIGTCFSGAAIPELEGEDRIIMTSSKLEEKSYYTINSNGETGAFFYQGRSGLIFPTYYDGVVKSLGSIYNTPNSLGYAFDKGYEACQNNNVWGVADGTSTPQINNKYLAEKTYI